MNLLPTWKRLWFQVEERKEEDVLPACAMPEGTGEEEEMDIILAWREEQATLPPSRSL